MSIFDKIWGAVKSLLPFLANAAEKTFKQLSEDAQQAGIDGSKFAQIIKDNIDATSDAVREKILNELSIDAGQLEPLLDAIRVEYKIPDALDVIKALQQKLHDAESELLHNSKVNEIFTIVATILSKGKLTWLTLLMGIGEYIYRKFVKGTDMVTTFTDPTPYELCRREHAGQAGYCDAAGGWHSASKKAQ